jgi:hypothetical protein
MALGALRHRTVDIMTGGTVKGGMFALIFHELLLLQDMAVKTGAFAFE